MFDPIGAVPVSVGEATALESFASYENEGKLLPTCEKDLLERVLRGKRLLNWQIKQWAEPPIVSGQVELREGLEWLPDWVWVAITNQRRKHFFKREIAND